MQRTRYSQMHITINTNKAANTASEEEYMVRRLEDFFNTTLRDPKNWEGLINIEPGPEAIKKATVDAIGIETGGKRHFVHAHFVVTIEHTGKVDIRWTQRQWQDLMNRELEFIAGSHAKVTLMNSRALNYAAKNTGTTDEILAGGMQESLFF